MKSPRACSNLALMSLLIGLASCSKESGGANGDPKGPDLKEGAANHRGDTGASMQEKGPPAKSGERTPTEKAQRLRATTQQIDQIEVERKKLNIEEHEKRVALNKLRGVADDTPIDITHPGVARGSAIQGKEEAFDAYLMVALQLQTLEAKEKLATEQLQRARDQTDGPPEDQKPQGSGAN
jgi:chaperonin cofactor prefoldin